MMPNENIGKLPLMPPEIAKALAEDLNFNVDLFALVNTDIFLIKNDTKYAITQLTKYRNTNKTNKTIKKSMVQYFSRPFITLL